MLGLLKKSTTYTVNNLFEWFGYKQSSTGVSVSQTTAIEVQAVLCAVRVIGEGIGQMPINIKKRRVVDNKVFTTVNADHWSHKLLAIKPNSWMSPYEFREHAVLIAALYGEFVALKNVVGGEVRELLPLLPGTFKVKRDENYNITYEVYSDGKVIGEYPRSQIFHLRGPSLDSFSGMDIVYRAREAIGLSKTLENTQAKMAANGGRPSGVLTSDQTIKPESAKAIKDAWTNKFGMNGEGGVAVLDGGWKFSSMQMTGVDSQHIETRKFQIEEVARAFRVSPQMLMHSDKASTFASAESFFRNHVIHTLGPWVKRFEGAVDRDILNYDASRFADLEERNLLRGDFRDQSDYYAKALGSGGTPAWMTQNEVRLELGLQPRQEESADQLFLGFQEDIDKEEGEEPAPEPTEEDEKTVLLFDAKGERV